MAAPPACRRGARSGQLVPKLRVIVHLAIVTEYPLAAGTSHWLVPVRAEVDNSEPLVRKADATV